MSRQSDPKLRHHACFRAELVSELVSRHADRSSSVRKRTRSADTNRKARIAVKSVDADPSTVQALRVATEAKREHSSKPYLGYRACW